MLSASASRDSIRITPRVDTPEQVEALITLLSDKTPEQQALMEEWMTAAIHYMLAAQFLSTPKRYKLTEIAKTSFSGSLQQFLSENEVKLTQSNRNIIVNKVFENFSLVDANVLDHEILIQEISREAYTAFLGNFIRSFFYATFHPELRVILRNSAKKVLLENEIKNFVKESLKKFFSQLDILDDLKSRVDFFKKLPDAKQDKYFFINCINGALIIIVFYFKVINFTFQSCAMLFMLHSVVLDSLLNRKNLAFHEDRHMYTEMLILGAIQYALAPFENTLFSVFFFMAFIMLSLTASSLMFKAIDQYNLRKSNFSAENLPKKYYDDILHSLLASIHSLREDFKGREKYQPSSFEPSPSTLSSSSAVASSHHPSAPEPASSKVKDNEEEKEVKRKPKRFNLLNLIKPCMKPREEKELTVNFKINDRKVSYSTTKLYLTKTPALIERIIKLWTLAPGLSELNERYFVYINFTELLIACQGNRNYFNEFKKLLINAHITNDDERPGCRLIKDKDSKTGDRNLYIKSKAQGGTGGVRLLFFHIDKNKDRQVLFGSPKLAPK